MSAVRVKICGITNKADASDAIALGADAIGFIFHPPSPRYVSPEKVADIIAGLPPFVSTVGLFVDMKSEDVRKVIDVSGVGSLQFHGEEEESQCDSFGLPWFKTIKMTKGTDVLGKVGRYNKSSAVLFDTGDPDLVGGTGKTFDWGLIPKSMNKPYIVAGGLNAQNVRKVIKLTKPFAVDVCSGVEREKGKKDKSKLKDFITFAKKREFNGQT
tara:strand:+ start:485 stop:1123 length:639 start_codon:yes stop_codon:yes gene_type:complete